nr:VWA domain-containing protein [Pirellulales bacterium]
MLTRYSFWTGLVGLATLVAMAGSAVAADSARLATYRQDGETSYALSLTADMPNKEVDAVDVVVLFDTSASQQGAYRETAIESLKALIAGLRPSDRVQVVAVDLNARPLNKDFAAAADPAVAEALTALGQQAPLGTTDLGAALDAAVKQFEMAESGSRAIVYIGDGISMANLLDAPTLAPLVAKMQAARVPVSSYAVGPETDPQLLAVLANQTGGNVYIGEPMVWQDEAAGVTDARAREENTRNADVAGKALAGWSRAAVMWPSKAQVPDVLGQVYPTSIPPLRADRDTILVGRTPADLTASVELTVQAAGADGMPVDLAWAATPEASGPDHAFLVSLVDGASRDGGITLPTVGVAGLAEVARMKGAQADQLTMLAQRAIASGDRAGALRIVQTVLQSDPGNVQARTVQNALEGAPADLPPAGFEPDGPVPGETVVVQPPADPAPIPADGAIILNNDPVVSAAPLPPAEPGLLERRGADGTFLDEVEQERIVYQRVLETEVQNTVRDARERMANEPQIAIQDLKLALENVSRAANLDPTTRAELEDKLQIALREAIRQASLKDELDALRNEELAAAAEAKQLNAQLQQRIDRISQLMNRFNALMDERRYVEAEEVAAVVEELDPNGVTPRVAALWARHKRHDYLQQVARSARHNAAWDTMYQIELSHIPFPDNPPIVYPDASVWEELTKRRKGVYEVDLASEGEAERRIYSALRQPLREPMDFVEQPLRDVVTILSETYDIPIQFDTAALDAVAASPDVEVSIQISNVSLKSALELMLKNAGAEALTYIVDNEVLLITTLEEAETRLQVKVYPVADLVMPIENIGMMGGGGGMMGGGGGGMRSVPPTGLPHATLRPGQTRHLPTRLVSLAGPDAQA